jgi:imidazolonepropionase-like amidohydrolase
MSIVFLSDLLIDGTGRDPVRSAVIIIEDGKITHVGKREDISFNHEEDQVVDVGESVILPGLIDSHCHLFSISGRPIIGVQEWGPEVMIKYVADGMKDARWWLEQGVTSVRDLGTFMNFDLGLRDLIAKSEAIGPRIFGSGRPIIMTGRDTLGGYEVNSASEARRAARQQLHAGADLIKLFASSGVGGALGKMKGPTGWEQLTVEEIKAASYEAHKAGRRIAAHALNSQAIKNAVLAGVDSIEHGTFLDEEGLEMMKARDVVLVPTLSVGESLAKDEAALRYGSHMTENARVAVKAGIVSLQAARDAGVRIAAGSDPTEKDTLPNECICLSKAGLTPMEVIVAATRTGAELLGMEDHLGTLEEGKIADLIILENNPLDDLTALERTSWVVKNGQIFKSPQDN